MANSEVCQRVPNFGRNDYATESEWLKTLQKRGHNRKFYCFGLSLRYKEGVQFLPPRIKLYWVAPPPPPVHASDFYVIQGIYCATGSLILQKTGWVNCFALPLLNHCLSSSKGPWAQLGKVSECPWCTFVTWFVMDSHFAFTCSPSPLLLAAHQYKWFEKLCFQFPRTAHDFFLASASIFLEMSNCKKRKIKQNNYRK